MLQVSRFAEQTIDARKKGGTVSLFSELLKDTADVRNASLAACLFKAKVLASKLQSATFRRWVDAELDGYV